MTRDQALRLAVEHTASPISTRLDVAALLDDLDAGAGGYFAGLRDHVLHDRACTPNERVN